MIIKYLPENMEEAEKLPKVEWKNLVNNILKNECKAYNGHLIRGKYCNPSEVPDDAAFCMDVGICNLCGQNMYEYILALGSRIKVVILRDNDGIKDNSLLPFTCVNKTRHQTDWLNLIRGLRKIDFDGTIVMDFSDSVCSLPLQLRSFYMDYAKKVGDYFEWQISMERIIRKYSNRVLFGAGNMCRNYMKCYGEEFPPLYTCDNNNARWGEFFEGLEIKNPQVLKELPTDCAIFICNIYYDEIEAQLREMRVTNPIERFNDEYMPSVHMDRPEY